MGGGIDSTNSVIVSPLSSLSMAQSSPLILTLQMTQPYYMAEGFRIRLLRRWKNVQQNLHPILNKFAIQCFTDTRQQQGFSVATLVLLLEVFLPALHFIRL